MKNKVLIITHGMFGVELQKSAEMIMGEQENVDSMGLVPGQSVDDLREKAFATLAKNEAEGAHTIIMCDLMGGSPSNVAMACLGQADCELLVGLSMPMLIEVLQAIDDDEDTEALANAAADAARDGVKHFNRKLIKKG
jgi:mannose/fructose/sorbose-specific phosphotransferase system IIA component